MPDHHIASRAALGTTLVAAALLAAAAAPASTAEPPATAIVIAIDTSGSLRTEELSAARELGAGLAAALPGGTFAVIGFDDESRLVAGWTADAAEVSRACGSLERSGRHTALHDALFDASQQVAAVAATRRAVVVITDGLDENSTLELMDGLAAARQAVVPVYTIGVGRVQERILRRIARLTGGEFRLLAATRPADLARTIASAPLPSGAPAAPAPAAARERTGTDGGARRASSPTAVSPSGPSLPARTVADSRMAPLIGAAAAGLLLLGAAAWVLRRRSRDEAPRCATCGRALANALSRCPVCPPQAAPADRPEGSTRAAPAPQGAGDEFSPTVIERLSVTEEFLEKTVTLRERPVLTILRGADAGRSFDLSPAAALSLGRARANDVVLEDVSVSSQHCRVRPEDGRYVVHDLKSTNGTWVNERKVTRHVLEEGDVLKVGETSLQFRKDLTRQ